ncbi:putative signal peptide protein [Puccinia sorghi]|uniref:Putative signal peptide protein n=1 Tax=Puccinia sorghi TaxID=27349 RepID=A0A0L6UL35_9BASI|nr:putative signal peptide protein [Puccinia sorghi]
MICGLLSLRLSDSLLCLIAVRDRPSPADVVSIVSSLHSSVLNTHTSASPLSRRCSDAIHLIGHAPLHSLYFHQLSDALLSFHNQLMMPSWTITFFLMLHSINHVICLKLFPSSTTCLTSCSSPYNPAIFRRNKIHPSQCITTHLNCPFLIQSQLPRLFKNLLLKKLLLQNLCVALFGGSDELPCIVLFAFSHFVFHMNLGQKKKNKNLELWVLRSTVKTLKLAALGINLFQRTPPPSFHSKNHKGNPLNHHRIICLTTFKIFYAKKEKKRHFGNLSLSKEKLAYECNDQFTITGPLIWDATRAGTPIEWHVYLLHSPSLPQFTKDSAYHTATKTCSTPCGLHAACSSQAVIQTPPVCMCRCFGTVTLSKLFLQCYVLISGVVFYKLIKLIWSGPLHCLAINCERVYLKTLERELECALSPRTSLVNPSDLSPKIPSSPDIPPSFQQCKTQKKVVVIRLNILGCGNGAGLSMLLGEWSSGSSLVTILHHEIEIPLWYVRLDKSCFHQDNLILASIEWLWSLKASIFWGIFMASMRKKQIAACFNCNRCLILDCIDMSSLAASQDVRLIFWHMFDGAGFGSSPKGFPFTKTVISLHQLRSVCTTDRPENCLFRSCDNEWPHLSGINSKCRPDMCESKPGQFSECDKCWIFISSKLPPAYSAFLFETRENKTKKTSSLS